MAKIIIKRVHFPMTRIGEVLGWARSSLDPIDEFAFGKASVFCDVFLNGTPGEENDEFFRGP
jgi:hypothetical protein